MTLLPMGLRRTVKFPKGRVGIAIVGLYLVAAIIGPMLTPYNPVQQRMSDYLQPVSWTHPLGTDEFGRDILARLIHGARISIGIALVASITGLMIGGGLGMLAGYYGRAADTIIMRLVDVLLSFPSLILAMVIAAIVGAGVWNVAIAVGVYSIPVFARLSRVVTQQVKMRDFVIAARSLGASDWRILRLHVLPNIAVSLSVVWTIRMGFVILVAASLSFLGLGVQPPVPEWGSMLSSAREFLRSSPGLAVYPGLAIVGITLGFNLLGDAVRDALDPRLRGVIG